MKKIDKDFIETIAAWRKSKISLIFSYTIPTEPGYNWVYNDINKSKYIVKVFSRLGHNYLYINNPDVCKHTKSDYWCIGSLNFQWCGPIQQPKLENE